MSKTDHHPSRRDLSCVDGGLTENERHFQHLAEAAFEGIVIHAKGVLITGNRQIFKMFGYEPHEMAGRNALPIVIAEESIEMVTDRIRTKDLGPYEAVGLRKNGSKFPIEIRAREIDWAGQKARVAAVMDITKRKRTEEALRRANEELERRVQERTELDDLGILAAITWFCSELKMIYKDIHFEESHRIQEGEIPDHIKIVLYRVLQESLRNVVQHSGADRVSIALTRVGDTIKLEVKGILCKSLPPFSTFGSGKAKKSSRSSGMNEHRTSSMRPTRPWPIRGALNVERRCPLYRLIFFRS